MPAKLPDGATLALATTYGVAKTMTGISNANPGIASLAVGHAIASGDFIEVTSGWSALNERTMKAGVPVADDVPLLGMNTTDVIRFPVGTGGGTVREVTAWTQISQILSFDTEGGDPTYVTYEFLEEDFQRTLPSVYTAQTIKIGVADDASLAGYIAFKAASDDRTLRALKLTLRDGSIILYTGIAALNETPSVTKGKVMEVTATFSLQGRPVRYAAP